MRLELDWTPPLKHRRGAPTNLDGIDVFHDFEWLDEFTDERTQFANGLRLARMVRKDCPANKRPALLLTLKEDAEEGARVIGEFYVLTVNLPRYIEQADADAAVSYLAGRLGPGLTRAERFGELARLEADEFAELLHARLDASTLALWAGANPERLALLRRLGGQTDEEPPSVDVVDAVAVLEALEELDPQVAQAIAELIGPGTDIELRRDLLAAMTGDADGRYVAGEILNQRTRDRLGDARLAVQEFDSLVTASSSETKLQEFLELYPWLLGLEYAQARPRLPIARGTIDFILERFDGFHDLLELKGPGDAILRMQARRGPTTPSASALRLSAPLALALAQVHVYRDALRHEQMTEELFGLRQSRDPRIIIVIGTSTSLSDQGQRILRELNRSLHRVEIVPYDVLGLRANAILDNVERYIMKAEDEVNDSGA